MQLLGGLATIGVKTEVNGEDIRSGKTQNKSNTCCLLWEPGQWKVRGREAAAYQECGQWLHSWLQAEVSSISQHGRNEQERI